METSVSITKTNPDNDIYLGTFGGEVQQEDYDFSGYGIQIDNLAISYLTPKEFEKLAIMMVNHLIINGHNYKIVKSDSLDQREKIIVI